MDILTEIGLLHAAYVEITSMEIRCDYNDYVRISQWQEFIRRGFDQLLDDIVDAGVTGRVRVRDLPEEKRAS